MDSKINLKCRKVNKQKEVKKKTKMESSKMKLKKLKEI